MMRKTVVLDHQWLLDRYDGDGDLVRELYLIFLQDAPPKLKALRRALDSGRREEVVHLTHGLKNMAGAAGAWKFMALATEAEQAARTGEPAQWEASYPRLSTGLEEAIAAIKATP